MTKYFMISVFIWLVAFIARCFIFNIPKSDNPDILMTCISTAMNAEDNKYLFQIILKYNIKGCVINIVGGIFICLTTVINLFYNGLYSADTLVTSYQSGLSINDILKTTVPHSFELIGFWLSGAIGFMIAWRLIQFMRSKEEFTVKFVKQIGILTGIVFVIILCAAWVEAYVSINMLR